MARHRSTPVERRAWGAESSVDLIPGPASSGQARSEKTLPIVEARYSDRLRRGSARAGTHARGARERSGVQHTSGAESHAASRPRNQHSRNRTGLGNGTRHRNLDDTGDTDGVIVSPTPVTRMMKTCMRTGLLRRKLV